VVRLPILLNFASDEISVSFSLLELGMWWNVIQPEIKGCEVAQFPQFCECKDFLEFFILIIESLTKHDVV
jgi:hypothetical protein